MNINAFGVFNCIKALVPRMGSGASIAVIASVAGFKPAPLLSAYVASKFAVVGLVKSAAMELGPRGIRVNAICPGFIHTPMQDREVVWEGDLRGMAPRPCAESMRT
jgi:NAD(P)-dependent dehydrogenase (short-subunit alcohol dehydrogenase family)